jgi:hypothetical protein
MREFIDIDLARESVFIGGMSHSGATPIAERLARDARVCNRDKSAWLMNGGKHDIKLLEAQEDGPMAGKATLPTCAAESLLSA